MGNVHINMAFVFILYASEGKELESLLNFYCCVPSDL